MCGLSANLGMADIQSNFGMADIQSPAAEIKRGKKRRTNDRMKIYMACPIT